MSLLFSRAVVLGSFFALALGLLTVYGLQLAETNEYMGYVEFPVDLHYILMSVAATFFIGMVMPTAIRRPSDFFVFLYGLFVLLPYATLFPIRNPVQIQDFMLFFSVLAGPLIIVLILNVAVPPLRVPRLVSQKAVLFLLVLLCIMGVSFALLHPTASAGFDLATSYERRIQGRVIYPAGSPVAYLNAAIVNGFAPFLAFVAGWHRRAWLMFFSLLCGVAYFYILGLKAPLLFLGLALLIGYSVNLGKIHALTKTIYALMLGAFLIFAAEYFLSGYSIVADYFFRRALSVPAWVSSAYFEFIAAGATTDWMPLHGVNSEEPITFLVGEKFLGFPGLNANTNAFIYQLASGGIPMYILTVVLVAFVFAVLDATYKCTQNPALVYLGFSYAILLTEQAATTALVSSGIGMLIMLVFFSGEAEALIYSNSREII